MAFKLDGETTDAELAARYGLDQRLIGKPEINEAIRQAVYQENIAEAESGGLSTNAAIEKANSLREESRRLQSAMSRIK